MCLYSYQTWYVFDSTHHDSYIYDMIDISRSSQIQILFWRRSVYVSRCGRRPRVINTIAYIKIRCRRIPFERETQHRKHVHCKETMQEARALRVNSVNYREEPHPFQLLQSFDVKVNDLLLWLFSVSSISFICTFLSLQGDRRRF